MDSWLERIRAGTWGARAPALGGGGAALCFLLVLWPVWRPAAQEGGSAVVVVYNRRMGESKALAEYYAAKRSVPPSQVLGFDLPSGETMSREEYQDQLEQPLLRELEKRRLWVFRDDIIRATPDQPGRVVHRVAESSIRYAVLTWGVPVRILPAPNLKEPAESGVGPEFRRNEAAVDSELATLPLARQKLPLVGPLRNALYGVTNLAWLGPKQGLLMVARLDGPSLGVARGLVDKSLEAEREGLWGRAYFDARGLTNSSYKVGDDWILGAAAVVRRFGFETVVDTNAATFGAAYPMSQIALYAGWYDGHVSGPFAQPRVDFMPGAIAYHLHSFSAATVRTNSQNWVGPLLAKGATATMGCVTEPFLQFTPDLTVFFRALTIEGATFGEAAYASQVAISWQTTVVGDPLYRPFGKRPETRFQQLAQEQSPLQEWAHLQVVNLNLAVGTPSAELIDYLGKQPATQGSAVLQEKLARLWLDSGNVVQALAVLGKAADLPGPPQQKWRLMLLAARLREARGETSLGLDWYQRLLRECPDYPGQGEIRAKLQPAPP